MSATEKMAQKYFDMYSAHRTAVNDHFRCAQQVALQFGNAIRDYLELPESFRTLDNRSESWTRFYQWDTAQQTVGKVVNPFDLDAMDATGTLRFALGLALSHKENSFPKTYFYVPCSVLPQPNGATLTLGSGGELGTFEIDTKGWDFTNAVSAFLSLLENALAIPPFDSSKSSPGKIGFL